MNKLISLKEVNLTYNLGANNAYKALSDINVDIDEGDFAIILGPSGCGKSSLLNIIAGLELPENGSVSVGGKDLLDLKESARVDYHRREIGMIFQAYNLISTLNVLDNVALPQIFINKRKNKRDQKSFEILERLGISEHAKKVPSELSGGQQQRIGIARSIINDPEFILADEPVGNLDSTSSNNVMEILSKLNSKENKTVVMVTHNPEHASWGNRIIHMRDGKITKIEIKKKDGKIEKENRESHLSGFEKFINRFKGLSKEQIKVLLEPLKARYLVDKLSNSFRENQLEAMEQKIKDRIKNKTSKEDLRQELDKSTKEGGVGLDFRTAKKFTSEIEDVLDISRKVTKESDFDTKAYLLIKYIVGTKNYQIKEENLKRAILILSKKLKGEIDNKEFSRRLDKSLSDKGAGLDIRIVDKIVEWVDIIQIISYGL